MEKLDVEKDERVEALSDVIDKLDRRMTRIETMMEELTARRRLGDVEFALRLAYNASQGTKTEAEAKENIAKLFNIVDDVYGRILKTVKDSDAQSTAQPQARQESEGVPSGSEDVIARLTRRLNDIEASMKLVQKTVRDLAEAINMFPFIEAMHLVRELGQVARNEAELKEKADIVIKHAADIYERLREVYLKAIKSSKEEG